jgi:acyl dehydratase
MTTGAREPSANAFAAFKIGDTFTCRMNVTQALMEQFSQLSGDYHPVHRDDEYARSVGFRGPIVFGNLMGAMVSRLVGMELPARDVLIARQALEFREAAYVGDELVLEAKVAKVHEAVQSVTLNLSFVASSRLVCTGQCLIKCI